MLKSIMPLYEKSILFSERPQQPYSQFYLFFDESQTEWIGIPRATITEKEVNILKTLYELVEIPDQTFSGLTKAWYEFLLLNGEPPSYPTEADFRFVQFHIEAIGADKNEIESALEGFFSDEVIIIWEDNRSGFIIEEKDQLSLSENDLVSMSETLESDFYAKFSFYIGKLYPFSKELRSYFHQEREYFTFAKKYLSTANIVSFERVFPLYVIKSLPDEVVQKIHQVFYELFTTDTELFLTIRVFLENNLNASLTAKQLYIHRNTLQYRIDKFVEKIGINFKDFYGAFTVFLACLLFEDDNMPKK